MMLIGMTGATAEILTSNAGGRGRVDGRLFTSIMGTDCCHSKSSSSVHSSVVHPIVIHLFCLIRKQFHVISKIVIIQGSEIV